MFETDGYVIFRDVIDQDLIKEVNDHVEWLQARHPEVRPEQLGHIYLRDDPFWVRLVSDDRLLDIALRELHTNQEEFRKIASRVNGGEPAEVWQKAKALSVDVYRTCHAGAVARDFALRDQMQRASVSVMSNIAEGFDRYSAREFGRFLSIARGSVGELRSQLYLARELGYLMDEDFRRLRVQCLDLTRMLTSLRKSLR